MAVLKRTQPSELPEAQVEYREPNSAGRWLALAAYIVLAFIIAVLIVLAARWVYHRIHHTDTSSSQNPSNSQTAQSGSSSPSGSGSSGSSKPNSAATTNPTNGQSSGSGGSGSSSSSPSSGSSSGSSSNKNKSGTTSPTSPTPPSGKLPNNGPGDVLALFAGASALAGSVHYAVTARKNRY